MNKIEIVVRSLQISIDGVILLVAPTDACAIDVLALSQQEPRTFIFNKYLANFTPIFNQPLSLCVDKDGLPFTESSFIAFAEANLGI